ncbi:MAG: hypothetical protein [Caudoviricetes sp.]|nr:MAG: hypothetical protein [Caudoviricetes sp.]
MAKHIDFIIDCETLGHLPDGILIDFAVVTFENDPANPPKFDELVRNGLKVKFDIRSQIGVRHKDASVVKWWTEQSDEAKINLKPSVDDLSLKEGYEKIMAFLASQGVKQGSSIGWCRGQSFDFSLFVTMIRNVMNSRETFEHEPCRFWNQRDIRTAVESYLGVRYMCECPLPMGALDGFIAHDSIHDCAKDVLMLIYAQRYSYGLDDVPSEDDADPRSLKKKR